MKLNRTFTALSLAAALAIGTASIGAYASGAIPGTKAAAFSQSKITAAQAVDRAAAQTQGQPVEVDFRHKHGRSYYKVEIAKADGKQEVFVDAADGRIIDSRPEYSRKNHMAQPNTAVSLKQALSAAEAKTGGRAKEAELKYRKGPAVYKVETVKGLEKYDVVVDAQSGQVLSSRIDL